MSIDRRAGANQPTMKTRESAGVVAGFIGVDLPLQLPGSRKGIR
jgi:hypothetical protein